jgi:hypothetical protein
MTCDGKAVDINLPPVTPGAPPPERPDGIQFDVIREPEFKEGDTIRVVTPEGERTFIVGEASRSRSPSH